MRVKALFLILALLSNCRRGALDQRSWAEMKNAPPPAGRHRWDEQQRNERKLKARQSATSPAAQSGVANGRKSSRVRER